MPKWIEKKTLNERKQSKLYIRQRGLKQWTTKIDQNQRHATRRYLLGKLAFEKDFVDETLKHWHRHTSVRWCKRAPWNSNWMETLTVKDMTRRWHNMALMQSNAKWWNRYGQSCNTIPLRLPWRMLLFGGSTEILPTRKRTSSVGIKTINTNWPCHHSSIYVDSDVIVDTSFEFLSVHPSFHLNCSFLSPQHHHHYHHQNIFSPISSALVVSVIMTLKSKLQSN